MKQTIYRLVLFFSAIAACFILASVYFELRVRQASDFFLQVERFRNDDVKPEVLLVGDSRMAANVDQRRLPPGYYNFSYPGETLRHNYLRIKFALETKPSVRYLVLGLEDVGFSDARARLRDATQQTLFADLVALTEIYPASPRFLLRHAVLHYAPLVNASQRRRTWERLLADMRVLLTGETREPEQVLDCGTVKPMLDSTWQQMSEAERMAHGREEVKTLYGGSAFNEEMHDVFFKILALARQHDVKVIGIRNPVTGAYAAAAQELREKPVLSFLEPNALHALLDYEALFADSPSLFHNADHLNAEGARKFTARLAEDLSGMVNVEAKGTQSCDDEKTATAAWPYNDVVTEFLTTPSCHNLQVECGTAPTMLSSPSGRSRHVRSQEVDLLQHKRHSGAMPWRRRFPPRLNIRAGVFGTARSTLERVGIWPTI